MNSLFYRKLWLILFMITVFPVSLYGLTVGPTIIMNNYRAGESTQGEINVYNEADFPIKVWVDFGDWEFQKDGSGEVDFKPAGSSPYSCADWIEVNPIEFELAPKESKKVSYTMTFPPSAKGGYYAAIFFTGEPLVEPVAQEEDESVMAITYRARIGVLVYNEVLGTAKKVSLLKFDILQVDERALKVVYEMKNEGLGYVRSEGKFHIIDEQGKLYASGVLKPLRLQQGDTGKAEGEWLGKLAEGRYDMVMTLELKPFGSEVIVKEKKFQITPTGLEVIE